MSPYHFPATPEWLVWEHPWALLLLLIVPAYWLFQLRRLGRPVIRFSSLATLHSAAGSWSSRLRLILPVLRTVAIVCLVVAVARPQKADETSSIYTEGIAIQMVVDTSSSMFDIDLAPQKRKTRLDVVKDVFRRFVIGDDELPGRPNDLVGTIRFARYADSICPLTLDRDALLNVLDHVQIVRPNSPEDGTAIGAGLALAVERLKDLKRITGSGEQLVIKSRVVILLTDGENNIDEVTPQQAGDLAALNGIKVYTILAGLGRRGTFGRLPVDDADLKRIAEVTGGKHFRARDEQSLTAIYEEIDQLERTKTEERRFLRWGELSFGWLVAAFVCLAVQTMLEATRLRKIP